MMIWINLTVEIWQFADSIGSDGLKAVSFLSPVSSIGTHLQISCLKEDLDYARGHLRDFRFSVKGNFPWVFPLGQFPYPAFIVKKFGCVEIQKQIQAYRYKQWAWKEISFQGKNIVNTWLITIYIRFTADPLSNRECLFRSITSGEDSVKVAGEWGAAGLKCVGCLRTLLQRQRFLRLVY